MAMTGGTAKLVAEGTPPGWPGSIKLYAYYKVKSQSTQNNTTTLSLGMYVTTPSGWYFGPWTDYGSYIGTATSGTNCKVFDGACPANTQDLRWLCENVEVTVDHNSDGTKTATIYWKWGVDSAWAGLVKPSGSFDVKLQTIPRASVITSAGNVTLGEKCNVKWTPKSASFRYKLTFSLGSWNYTTGAIHPNTTSAYTYTGYAIPEEVANQIPNAYKAAMTVELQSFSDSSATTKIGSDSDEFDITVPTTAKPKVTMSVSPVHSLPSAFNGLYIQGLSKVKATLNATTYFNASVKSYDVTVEGKTYDADDSYTSKYLTNYGSITVSGHAVDSRSYGGYAEKVIDVLPYSSPKLTNVSARRCTEAGKVSDSGTYLKISAKRVYSPCVASEVQKNFCKIQYRYKESTASSWSAWTVILAANSTTSDSITTGALLAGALQQSKSYDVEVQAVDTIGRTASVKISVSTDTIYWHRDGANNALGLGKYAEEENILDVAWNTRIRGDLRLGDEGNLMDDFVIDAAVVGGWRYKKWNSGSYEMYGTFDVQPTESNTVGSGFYSDQIKIEVPFDLVTANLAGTSGESLVWIVNGAIPSGVSNYIGFRLMRFTAISTTSPYEVRLSIRGRWK